MKYLIVLFGFVLSFMPTKMAGQYISGLATRFDNDKSQWVIYPENDSLPECSLTARWRLQDDPSEWDFKMGEVSGTIRLKWKNRLDEWEIISENITLRLKMVWPGDARLWRLETPEGEINISQKYNQPVSEWTIKLDKDEIFSVYPVYEGDPRDWTVEDNLSKNLPISYRVGCLFPVIMNLILNN